jgi:hypothetical protein
MPAQWPRALIRAELREAGYDAVGARDLLEALGTPDAPGPFRLILLDQSALSDGDPAVLRELLDRLVSRHDGTRVLLLAGTTHEAPEGPRLQVLRRPKSISDIVAAIGRAVPLPEGERQPLD